MTNQQSVKPKGSLQDSNSIPIKNSPQVEKLKWFKQGFRPHFNEWAFGPIERLVRKEPLIGFIFMSCIIDYLAGFYWGKSTLNNVRKAYTEFIGKYFPKDRYDAKGLYKSLRNGLVHSFTIKNKTYALTNKKPEFHLKEAESGHIVLNAEDFRDDLIAAKDKYFNDVESSPDLLNKVIERYNRDGFLGPKELEFIS